MSAPLRARLVEFPVKRFPYWTRRDAALECGHIIAPPPSGGGKRLRCWKCQDGRPRDFEVPQ